MSREYGLYGTVQKWEGKLSLECISLYFKNIKLLKLNTSKHGCPNSYIGYKIPGL